MQTSKEKLQITDWLSIPGLLMGWLAALPFIGFMLFIGLGPVLSIYVVLTDETATTLSQVLTTVAMVVIGEPVGLFFAGMSLVGASFAYDVFREGFELLARKLKPGTKRLYLRKRAETVNNDKLAHFTEANGYNFSNKKATSLASTLLTAHTESVYSYFSGKFSRTDMTFNWYAISDSKEYADSRYDVLRLKLKGRLPHIIIDSSISDVASLLSGKVRNHKPVKLSADASKYFRVLAFEKDHVKAAQQLSSDVLLALLEKTPVVEIELHDQHIDFAWQSSTSLDEIQRRLAAAEVIAEELQRQLEGRPGFAHRASARMRMTRWTDRYLAKGERWFGWIMAIFGAGALSMALAAGLAATTSNRYHDQAFPGSVDFMLSVLAVITALYFAIGLLMAASFMYVGVLHYLLNLSQIIHKKRSTSQYFATYFTKTHF